jgi:2-dehydropantoate 2-reductase
MRIVIVGMGAVGSILAANLIRGGADVVCVARGSRARQVREQGLRITGRESIEVPARVAGSSADIPEADLVVLATKTYDNEAALESVRHVRTGRVVSLANGIYKNEQVAKVFGAGRTLGGVAAFGGELNGDGSVSWTIYERLSMGVIPRGNAPDVDAMGKALNDAGFHTEISSNISTVEWSKYAVFVGLMPVAVLSRQPTYRMFGDPDLARACLALFREMAQLAAKQGIELEDAGGMTDIRTVTSLPEAQALEYIRRSGEALVARGARGHKVSTLQDLEHGRRFELEEILGYAVRKGEELAVAMPAAALCYRLVKGLEQRERKP